MHKHDRRTITTNGQAKKLVPLALKGVRAPVEYTY